MTLFSWVLTAICLLLVLGPLVWEIWAVNVRPRFLDSDEIARLAARYIERYGAEAAKMAFAEEDRAWRYCNSCERGKWRRIRREIERLQE